MRFLLDTNAVIALFNNDSPRLSQRVRTCQVSDIGLSASVAYELFYTNRVYERRLIIAPDCQGGPALFQSR